MAETASTGIFNSLNQEIPTTGIYNSLNNNESLVNSKDSSTSDESATVPTGIFNSLTSSSGEISVSDSELERKQRNFHNMTDANQKLFIDSLSEDDYKKIMQTGTVYNTHDAMYDRIAANQQSSLAATKRRVEGDGEESEFWFGFDQQRTDVQNWGLWLESKYSMGGWHNKWSKPRPEGVGEFEWRTPEQLYGYDDPDMPRWADMSDDARRIRLLELFDEAIVRKYPKLSQSEQERTKAEIGGNLFAFLATPSTFLPIGKAYKTMIAIGAALGFEWGAAEGLANEGEINWTDTAIYTGVGAIAAPLLVASGRAAVTRFKRFRLERNEKLTLRAAQDLLDD